MRKKDLRSATRQELLEIAAGLKIRGRTRMNKAQLARAIAGVGEVQPKATKTAKKTRVRKGSVSRSKTSAAPNRKPSQKRRGPLREIVRVRKSWREQQAVITHSKYQTEMPAPAATPEATTQVEDLPVSYDEDRIALLVRDPYWVHVYWDITRDTLARAQEVLGERWREARSILRVYDVTGVQFDGTNANSFFDIEITGGATNWYVNVHVPNRAYCVEVGLLSVSGEFVMLARSNVASTPRDVPSDVTDEEWMIPDWEFDQVYALSGGFNPEASSIELKEMMEKSLGGQVGSGAPGSLAPSSIQISSPMGRPRGRAFWFRLGTELIVYGATEPDARVTLQGRPVELRPDGTFTVRFDLPEGEQVIPAVAESADGIDRITITPVVRKKTGK
jgi:hypothetical protein